MGLGDAVNETKEKSGACYGCASDLGERCEEGKDIKMMRKKETNPPCYMMWAGVMGTYNTKDEFGNVETKYRGD